jgi:hypothetical protein
LRSFARLYQALNLPEAELLLWVKNLEAALQTTPKLQAPLPPQRLEQLAWLGISARSLARLSPYIAVLPSATPVNINTASVALLRHIAGLNQLTARRLLEHRTEKPFTNRQQLREVDTVIRDTRPKQGDGFFTSVAKSVGYSIMPGKAPAKLDVWGNEVQTVRGDLVGGTRATDLAFRIFDPSNAQVNPQADPIDRWIFRWNQQAADSDEQISIQPIFDRITLTVPGEKKPQVIPLTRDEWQQANREAGQMARKMLGDGWDQRPLDQQTAEIISKTVRDAQRTVRANLRVKKLGEAIEAE